MSALCRCLFFSRVSKLKESTGLVHVMRFGFNAVQSPQWKTPSNILSATATKSEKLNVSFFSSSSSTKDGPARVRRVSIEGNIGKYKCRISK